jgi:hypothetical protein
VIVGMIGGWGDRGGATVLACVYVCRYVCVSFCGVRLQLMQLHYLPWAQHSGHYLALLSTLGTLLHWQAVMDRAGDDDDDGTVVVLSTIHWHVHSLAT